MPKCFKCGADTILFENGVAICVKCSDEGDKRPDSPEKDQRIRSVLLQDLLETSYLAQSASVESETRAAGRRSLDSAQTAMAHAHSRLNNYLSRGIVPEDLKQAI